MVAICVTIHDIVVVEGVGIIRLRSISYPTSVGIVLLLDLMRRSRFLLWG